MVSLNSGCKYQGMGGERAQLVRILSEFSVFSHYKQIIFP